ncbi:hypothetical protein Dtox_2231 [Desulfofarcimen acetoxidans DSM 771]|uniref:DUF262 domain-containing protein n=1 Tax=Desulfofarcimen acetoxidans (strain ATCC 49208 / DSM 771 / KCTC 5769 / VKM B-1644 / 5575) TaxID=485916 RepID=C8VZS0_DESAS|nr:hypothetical protein [Desulfofarcimen acetoxidans]ACV63048.1 hypothetical protein Dtox_2231 [Desulfofarcimen acetoxidans DSM 771]
MSIKKIHFAEIAQTALEDRATGGRCHNCYLSIREYVNLITEINTHSNEFQRRIISIKKSLIYQKLVKDLLRGVVIPTISLFFDDVNMIVQDMEIEEENVQVLDGLQRTNCILYALKILSRKTEDDLKILSTPNILTIDQFLDDIKIRVEIWTSLTVNGILYKMVSLNAGQTPMDLEHQFEILELPLKHELNSKYQIEIFTREEERKRRESLGFNISNLVEGIIAYNTESIFPKKQATAISIMDSLDIKKNLQESAFVKNDFLMQDLVWVIDTLHKKQIEKYDRQVLEKFKGIFADSDVFFIPFMAALGKARKDCDDEQFNRKKERLINLLDNGDLDPWSLQKYEASSEKIKSNIGQKRRRMVFYTFLMYFTTVDYLDWNLGSNFI